MNIEEIKLPYEFDQVVYFVSDDILETAAFKGVHIDVGGIFATVVKVRKDYPSFVEMCRVSSTEEGAIEKYIIHQNNEFKKETYKRKEKMNKRIEELKKENGLTDEGNSDE